jgi:hypothetical protein
MRAHHRSGKKKVSVTNLAGIVLGEYVSLTAGDTMSLTDSVKAGGMNLARQQLIGMTGYDLQTNSLDAVNALRFWGPVVAMKALQIVGHKLVGPVKLSKGFKLF